MLYWYLHASTCTITNVQLIFCGGGGGGGKKLLFQTISGIIVV